MKVTPREYRKVDWDCINPDGSSLTLSKGDTVRIIFDVEEDELSPEEYPNNTVIVEIFDITTKYILGKHGPDTLLMFYPQNIVEISKV